MSAQQAFEEYAVRSGFSLRDAHTLDHFASGQEWRLGQAGRILRWAPVAADAAWHIQQDAAMLAVLGYLQVPAPRLLSLDAAQAQHVASIQKLPHPQAVCLSGEGAMPEATCVDLGRYLRELHSAGGTPYRPDAQAVRPVDAGLLDQLEVAGRLSASERRWLASWCRLLPQTPPLVLTHGFVHPSWVVVDPAQGSVLGLTDWSLARTREAGSDFLHLPAAARPLVLKGYGGEATGLYLSARLRQWMDLGTAVAQGVYTPDSGITEDRRLADLFGEELRLLGLSRRQMT